MLFLIKSATCMLIRLNLRPVCIERDKSYVRIEREKERKKEREREKERKKERTIEQTDEWSKLRIGRIKRNKNVQHKKTKKKRKERIKLVHAGSSCRNIHCNDFLWKVNFKYSVSRI